LPAPDGGTKGVSNRNLAGHLFSKNENRIVVKEYRSGELVAVDTSKVREYYSAFGGDASPSDVKIGVAMRIWYENCDKPVNNFPKAAYVEFFSNSAGDQPEKSYFFIRGQ